jgi:hypothetical protein
MEEGKAQNGLIGFFDILGYRSFLENNDVERATEVLDIINNIKSDVTVDLQRRALNDPQGNREKILENIKWLVFSDTILMAMPWNKRLEDLLVFSFVANRLCRKMFDFGLPLRGAIKSGKYLIRKFCFAGQVIVEAYNEGKKVNLAGCTIDQALIARLAKGGDGCREFVRNTAVHYSTPLNDGSREKMYLLNYMTNQLNLPKENAFDIPQLVLNSFWAWDKDIDASAEIRARNSETFLRFLAHRFPQDFRAKAREPHWSES